MGAWMAPDNMANERVQSLLGRIIEMFKSGELPPTVARTVIKQNERNMIPSDNWSLGNQILMLIQGTEDARGFRQWQEAGRSVKKGVKAIYILAPRKRTITVTTRDPETGEEIIERMQIITGFRDIPVFRYEDTEGQPFPDRQGYEPPQLPPLHEVGKYFGVDEIIYAPFDGSCYGFYTWNVGKKIVLHTHDVKTWFHELGHAIHNTFRPLRGGQVPEQEIVAELFAATMCELHGISGYHQYSWDYMKSYSGNDQAKTLQFIFRILSDVEECLNRVMAVVDIIGVKHLQHVS